MKATIISTTLAFSSMCLPSTARLLRRNTSTSKRNYPKSHPVSLSELEQQSDRDEKGSRIIGGSEATPNRYSFAASLQDQMGHFCGGSLIAKDVVLSAAHCAGGQYSAVLGRHNLKTDEGQNIDMRLEVTHPNYNEQTTDNDFMLVFLSQAATLNSDVSLVAVNNDSSSPNVGEGVTVAGWGDTHISDSISQLADELMEVQVTVVSNQECDDSSDGQDSYQGEISENMLCAEHPSQAKDACQGDSGGPLVTTGSSEVQVGVVSWGIGCASDDFPGVYARVSRAYSWIQSEVCKNSQHASEAGFDCSNISYDPAEPASAPAPSPGGGGGNGDDYFDDDWSPNNNGGGNGDDYYDDDDLDADWNYSGSSGNNGDDDDDDWSPNNNGEGNGDDYFDDDGNGDDWNYSGSSGNQDDDDDDWSPSNNGGGNGDDYFDDDDDDWNYSGSSGNGDDDDDDWSPRDDDDDDWSPSNNGGGNRDDYFNDDDWNYSGSSGRWDDDDY